jgi:hypothetical protein
MMMHATIARRLRCAAVAALAVLGSTPVGAEEPVRWLVAFETPSEHVLHELAVAPHFDVRWVEPDLVLAEVARPDDLPSLWGGRIVARRRAGEELALLHARNAEALRARVQPAKTLRQLRAARVATLHSARDELWVLLGPADAWPAELLGCHGGLVLPSHRIDPRSLIASGPPPQLLPWVLAPERDWTAGERDVLNAVNEDSIVAFFDLLTRNENGFPADRYVFSRPLQDLYIPRAAAAMRNAVAGVSGADTLLQRFKKTRRCPSGIDTVTTANVIARLPGTVPSTGTFVVCAHLDATGSRDAEWGMARDSCEPLVAAPGGEDNASGVAVLLEALRCIADGVRSGTLSFAFDLEFVAFSGEEAEGSETQPDSLGRFFTGSELFVREHVAANDTLLGAFNLDMIGSEHQGNNLQLVHNPASEWFADFVVRAASSMDPSPDVTFTLEPNMTPVSDHNSFWAVNATAILGADASVEIVRNYATYHQPFDTGFDRDVRSTKLREVTRAVVATLLRFDANAHTEPALFVPVESFRTSFELNGQEANYDHTFLRLFPGEMGNIRLKLFNLGAEYDGPVRLVVRKVRQDGTSVVVTDDSRLRRIPTGGLVEFQEPVHVFEDDAGITRLVAEVSWDTSSGLEVTTAVDTLAVRGRHRPEIAAFRPNPVRDLQNAELLMELSAPGMVTVRLYNLEGERVYKGSQIVSREQLEAKLLRPGEEPVLTAVRLLAAAPGRRLSLVSGPYFARVQFRGDDGSQAATSARLVVVR